MIRLRRFWWRWVWLPLVRIDLGEYWMLPTVDGYPPVTWKKTGGPVPPDAVFDAYIRRNREARSRRPS